LQGSIIKAHPGRWPAAPPIDLPAACDSPARA